MLLTVTLSGVPNWVEQGPGPIDNGNTVTLPAGQNNQQAAAVESVAVNPNNPAQIIIGTANGGVWRTTNANPSTPTAITWTPLTDQLGSLSIGVVAYDPNDATGNTFYAGTGDFSEGFIGGPAVGLYKTTDAGATWSLLGDNSGGTNILAGNRIKSIVVDGSTIIVGAIGNSGTNYAAAGGGLFISTDGGAIWSQDVGAGATNLPAGPVTSVIQDPNDAQRIYAAVVGQGIFRNDNAGAPGSWIAVNTSLAPLSRSTTDIELSAQSIAGSTTLFAGISADGSITNATNASPIVITAPNNGLVTGDQVFISGVGGNTAANSPQSTFFPITSTGANSFSLNGTTGNGTYTAGTGSWESFNVFTSTNNGGAWTQLANFGSAQNFFAGAGFNEKFQVLADPSNAGVVYIDGEGNDFQPRIYRYNPAASGSWVTINASGASGGTSPHPDSRQLAFVGTNVLLDANDGGLYEMQNPTNAAANTWNSFNGNLEATEIYSVAYDQKKQSIAAGVQDDGSPQQVTLGNPTWTDGTGGDGQFQAVDATSPDAGAGSLHYALSDGFQFFNRLTYNSAGTLVSTATVGLRSSFGAANLSGLDTVDQGIATSGGFNFTPFVLNNIDPRMMLLGDNGLYEDNGTGHVAGQFAGDVITELTTETGPATSPTIKLSGTTMTGTFSAFAYGGNFGGAAFSNVAVVGTGSGQLLFRGQTGSAFTDVTASLGGAGGITSVALDPQDWRHVYVIKGNQVFVTADITNLTANPFQVIGGGASDNLLQATGQPNAPNLSAVAVVDVGTTAVALVSAFGGVYRVLPTAPTANPADTWSRYGQGLPNVVAESLTYNATDDVLVVGTFGRGAWTIPNVSTSLLASGVLTIDGDQDYPGEDDTIKLIRDPVNAALLDVFLNGTELGPFQLSTIQQIDVNGLGGNDTLIIDSSNGLIDVANGIRFDGGTGFNKVQLVQTGGATQTSDTYSVGPNNGEGTDVIVGPSGTQTLYFQNLAPVLDTVPSPTLIVNATPASNAINYANANDGTGDGLVTIDNQESIEFANKTNLTLNGEPGDDTINLNYQPTTIGSGPQKPAGLTSINVNGGDPTASDKLIVNGVGAELDNLFVTPTGPGAGTVTDLNPTFVPVTFSTIENLSVVGQSADGDTLQYNGTTGNDTFELSPGATPDSGTITGFEASIVAPFTFVPVQFSGFGGIAGNGSSVVLDSGFGSGPAGGTDTAIVDGAVGGNTTFSLLSAAGSPAVQLNGNFPKIEVDPAGSVATLSLRGIGPDNTFDTNVSNNAAFPATLTVQVLGTGATPSEDVLNYTATSGAATTIDYATSTISQTGPTTSPVTFSGIGILNETSSGAGSTLTIIGAALASTLTYTPSGANAGTVALTGANPTINFTGVGSTFTIDGDTAGLANQVYVDGTPLGDTFLIDEPTRTVTVTSPINNSTPPITLMPVVLGPKIASLSVFGLAGDDTFTVNPAPVSAVVPSGLPVNIDGNGPEASDALIVNATAATQFTVLNQGRNPNSGTVRVYDSAVADPDISYTNVEIVDPNTLIPPGSLNAPNLLILGPDDYEANNFLNTATFLGSGSTLQIQQASIFPNATENGNNPGVPADQDFYQVVAQQTGTLDFQVYFQLFSPALLPGGGDLEIQVYNAAGLLLGSSSGGAAAFGAASTLASSPPTGDRVRIPAVEGQSYFLRVTGALNVDGHINPTIVNGYNATIINTPAPVPYDIELSRSVPAPIAGNPDTGDLPPNAPADDTGRSQFDNVTNVNMPTIYVHLDDATLLQDLQGNQANNSPPIGQIPIPFNTSTSLVPVGDGYRIALYDDGGGHDIDPNDPTFLGFAQMVATPGYPHLYSLVIGSQTPIGMPTDFLSDGIHNITAKVQIIDPQTVGAPPVQTETGFGSRSVALAITVDTVPPPVMFGITSTSGTSTGLAGSSDSGVQGIGVPPTTPSETTVTLSDKITNVEEPTFYGTAEANAIVKLYAIDKNGNSVLLGQTTATPLDGTNADPTGQWTITSTVDLNDPTFFAFDGVRHLYVTATDLAGNTNSVGATAPFGTTVEQLDIFLDTTGPQITGVGITGDPTYNLFGIKAQIGTTQGNNQANQGPTPLVSSIDIDVQDLPVQVAEFLREAIIVGIAETPGGITLTGDASGIIAIKSITVVPPAGSTVTPLAPGGLVPAGMTPTDIVRITFYTPLPDDRYTLTINDTAIVDVAGNDLDGESNANEPNGAPNFPSGDGQPGGNFVARFTVDSRPEIGTYAAGSAYIDINGNMVWDPTNTDATNRDLIFTLGVAPSLQGTVSPMGIHDALIAGDFLSAAQIAINNPQPQPPGVPAMPLPNQAKIGYDKLAAYGYDPLVGGFRWLINTSNSQTIDPSKGDYEFAMAAGSQINGVPLAGDFALSPALGDQIGLFDGTTWYLDTSTAVNNITSFANAAQPGGSLQFSTPFLRGAPVVGDFNGALAPNGAPIPDLATYLNGTFNIVFGQYNAVTKSVFFVADAAHEDTVNFGFAGVGGIPVAADMNGDGYTDLGVYEPRTTGVTPQTSEWYFLISNPAANSTHLPNASALNHPFSPTPVGNDIFADFGDQTALPIVGNFDPPVTDQVAGPTTDAIGPVLGTAAVSGQNIQGQGWYSFSALRSGTMTVSTSGATGLTLYDANQDVLASGGTQVTSAVTAGTQYLVRVTANSAAVDLNFANSIPQQTLLDVNQDGVLSPLDALTIINELNSQGPHVVALTPGNPDIYLDVNQDGLVTPLDALDVINALNAAAATAKGGTAAVVSAAVAATPSSAAAGGSVTAAVGTATGSSPSTGSTPSTSILAIDAVFAGLASSSEPTTSTNLQSKAAASTLSTSSPAVRKTSNTAGSSGADAV